MFDGLKKLFSTERTSQPVASAGMTRDDRRQIADWALAAGLSYTEPPLATVHGQTPEQGFMLDGKVMGKPWRVECGAPARDFIRKRELRARCDVGLPDSVAVVVMNRVLHTTLEKQAFALYTDSVQTVVDAKLSEEMRWLAIFPVATWPGAPPQFFERYAVLAANRHDAPLWPGTALAKDLMKGAVALAPQYPFMLMLLRGKCYLRMQYSPANLPVLQLGIALFTSACEYALTQPFQGRSHTDDEEDKDALVVPDGH